MVDRTAAPISPVLVIAAAFVLMAGALLIHDLGLPVTDALWQCWVRLIDLRI
jgi:hypothetical protein